MPRRNALGVTVMAEPSASIWEVTQLILQNPDASAAEVAQAHGFSAADVAEMLPLFVDNLRIDFSQPATPGFPAAEAAPGESPEAFVERYLTSLGQTDGVDVVTHDTLGTEASDLDGNGSAAALPPDGAVPPAAFGTGGQPPDTFVEPPASLDGPELARLDATADPFEPGEQGPVVDPTPDLTRVDGPSDVADTDFQFD